MAKDKVMKDQTQDEPSTTTAAEVLANKAQAKPKYDGLTEIALELVDVAEGGSIVDLRSIVNRVCPATKEEAAIFAGQLKRMTSACEMMTTLAREKAAMLEN